MEQGHRVALVCSARSGSTKATGTTSLLLKAAEQALNLGAGSEQSAPGTPTASGVLPNGPAPLVNGKDGPHSRARSAARTPGVAGAVGASGSRTGASTPSRGMSGLSLSGSLPSQPPQQQRFNETVDQIKDDHLKAARASVKSHEIREELEDEIDYDCERLRSFLLAAQIIDEVSAKSRDIIMGVGERLSCRIVTAVLRDRGIDAELVSLENIVDAVANADEDGHSRAGQLEQPFYDRLARMIGERLAECEDRVPVVTGFFGVVPGSLLNQVGRGYTDLCAALCAVGTGAAELQIWKEVDGIFTADPRKVSTARLLPIITPEEAAELTYYGSEVIHPFTMEQVIRAAIPIRIKNVERPAGEGTIIFPDRRPADDDATPSAANEAEQREVSRARHALSGIISPKLPTAVTYKDHVTVLSIRSNRKTISHGFLARLFGTLDRYGIVVDLISTSEVHVSMAINSAVRPHTLQRLLADLSVVGDVAKPMHEMAILSLVGKEMKNQVGTAGKMFTTLARANINIEMISQGASEINISCVINKSDAVKALNVVHHELLSQAAAAAAA